MGSITNFALLEKLLRTLIQNIQIPYSKSFCRSKVLPVPQRQKLLACGTHAVLHVMQSPSPTPQELAFALLLIIFCYGNLVQLTIFMSWTTASQTIFKDCFLSSLGTWTHIFRKAKVVIRTKIKCFCGLSSFSAKRNEKIHQVCN